MGTTDNSNMVFSVYELGDQTFGKTCLTYSVSVVGTTDATYKAGLQQQYPKFKDGSCPAQYSSSLGTSVLPAEYQKITDASGTVMTAKSYSYQPWQSYATAAVGSLP